MNPFRSDNPMKIYEYHLVTSNDNDMLAVFDTWEEAYKFADGGDTIEQWCKCSSYVIPVDAE